MLALTLAYASLGATPLMRAGLDGLGPVVLGIFAVAVYRLGRATATTIPQLIIAIMAAAVWAFSPLPLAAILALAAGIGIWRFHARRVGAVVLLGLVALLALIHVARWFPLTPLAPASDTASLVGLLGLSLFFFKVGALTFGGGATMIALIQAQVVHQFQWLTPQQFLDGLALGQLTPGPVLMLTAYVGYRVAGLAGAALGAVASFLPSFLLMLVVLPMLDRVRRLRWIHAAMRGVEPAVSGVFAVSLIRMAPPALPDLLAVALLMGTLIAAFAWRLGAIPLLIGGAGVGVVRSRLCALPSVRATLRQLCASVGT